ncbi:MAG TPA: response regulator [Anaeromyxobacter sp.]|nr:response regulator [Anaeromyxobacter sp.]
MARGEAPVELRIGDLLVKRGVMARDDVDRAVREAQTRGMPLLSYLLLSGVDEGALAGALAERHRMPGVNLSRSTLALEAIGLVPQPVADSDVILPLSLDGGRLHLAMSQPLDERVVSEVRFVTGLEVSPYAAVKHALLRTIAAAYETYARGDAVWRGHDGPPTPHLELVFPARPEDEEVIEIVDDADLAGEAVPVEVVYPDPLPPRSDGRPVALVVDDEPEIRQLVQRMLESKGFAVETAVDGEQALAKAEVLVPDVILLDAMLPKVHGFEACRRLKSASRTRLIPVVMMTAVYRGWRFAHDARETYGAEDYVEKPFRLDDLYRRVQAARESSAARLTSEATPAEPLVQRARELLAAGDVTAASEVLSEAVRADPYAAEAHFLLGRMLRAKGDAFGAMTALERAAELRPGHLAALRTLSALYEEKGFRHKAAEALERALTTAPETSRETLKADLLRLLG